MNIQNPRTRYSTEVIAGPICQLCGVSWYHLLGEGASELSAENRSGQFVYAHEYYHLWDVLCALCPNGKMSHFVGERMAVGPAVPVLLAMSWAPNLMVGIERLSRFDYVFGPISIRRTQTDEEFSIDLLSVEAGVALSPAFSASSLIYMQASCRHLAVSEFAPSSVRLPLSLREREDLIDVFGCFPEYGPPRLVYRKSDALEPFVSENTTTWMETEAELLSQSKLVTTKSILVQDLEDTLLALFGRSSPTLEAASAELNISRSTLVRQLRAQGTTFQTVLDGVRQTQAIQYLSIGKLSTQQIAYLVGYSDPNAFHRAFKKWTGETPGNMRDKLRGKSSMRK